MSPVMVQMGSGLTGDGRAAVLLQPFASGDGDRIYRRAYRDAVGGLLPVPWVRLSARRRAELGRPPSQIDMSPVRGADGQRG